MHMYIGVFMREYVCVRTLCSEIGRKSDEHKIEMGFRSFEIQIKRIEKMPSN